jgi:hypothetical protein
MAIEPLKSRPQSMPETTEVSVRDMRENAAKASKDRAQTKLEDESAKRTREGEKLREEQRVHYADVKKDINEVSNLRQERSDQENRRTEQKKNPDSGNIVNVIA